MATVMIKDNYLTNIGDAIRNKIGDTTTYKPSEMADAIKTLKTDMDNLIVAQPSNITLTEYLTTNIRDYGFADIGYDLDMWDINLPNVAQLGVSAFKGACLNSLQLPKLTTVGDYCFENINIPTLNLSKVITMSNKGGMFWSAQINNLIWPKAITNIPFDDFTNASIINLILPGDIMVKLGTFDLGNGDIEDSISMSYIRYIYVPANLLYSYQTNLNWSKYANSIRAIEDYPEIQALIE